jgi:hypothetical protein
VNLAALYPVFTGAGGALAVLVAGVTLFLSGKLHSDAEFSRVLAENDALRTALTLERQANNELARTGSITTKLLDALVNVTTDRQLTPASDHTRQHKQAEDAAPDDLGF